MAFCLIIHSIINNWLVVYCLYSLYIDILLLMLIVIYLILYILLVVGIVRDSSS
nr:MAG TPA: hypothetical protein [Caudoviricetes sp.]